MRGPSWVRCAVRLLLALSAGLGAATRADATTFVPMDERDLAARSLAAVIATVDTVDARDTEGGAIATAVGLTVERVLFGALSPGSIVLREPGGRAGGRTERIFGAPEYQVGERVLVFLSRRADGGLRTTAMAMGKYRLGGGAGAVTAQRDLGDEVAILDPASGDLHEAVAEPPAPLAPMLARVAAATRHRPTVSARARQALRDAVRAPAGRRFAAAPFVYLGAPSRWFEPDDGEPIHFLIDATGDATLGADASTAAAVDALAAWSTVPGAALLLSDGVLDQPLAFNGCSGDNRVVFNDPFGEIEAPVDCRGVLGIGGYCYSDDETRTVSGTNFRRIRLGKVTLADGFAGCPFWNECGLAQIATHEVGHAIGLGHSPDTTSTMTATARFDGRCAGLGSDDLAGLRFIYPALPTPTPTSTELPQATPTATPTASPTRTRTATSPPVDGTPGANTVSGQVRYYSHNQPVPGVIVDLHGGADRQATTGITGQYAFAAVADGAWAVEPVKEGDLSNGISALDAAHALQAVAGLRALEPLQAMACDVTGNGSVSTLDATRILQRKVGLIERFPAADLCASDWLFMPAAVPALNQESVAPLLDLGTCRGGALTYAPLIADAVQQDFRAALIGDCTGNWQPGDVRTAEPEMAPAGSALEMAPLRRVRGNRWRQAIGVRVPEATLSLDLELRYDTARLHFEGVRSVRLDGSALLDASLLQPGRLRVALASSVPLPADGRTMLVVDFTATDSAISARLVRPYQIAVDERLVPTPHR